MNQDRFKPLLSAIYSLALVLLVALPGHSAAESNTGWKSHLALYAWLAGQNGTVATFQGLPPSEIDIDFWDDILENVNAGLFLIGEARKGRWGVFMDIAYVDIESDDPLPTPAFSSLVSGTKSWIVTASGEYLLAEKDDAYLNIFAGIRYWSVDSTLTLRAGVLPQQEVTNTEDWFDPIIGLRGYHQLGTKVFISGTFGIGGFGAGSDFMWDVIVNLGYHWTDSISTTIGYRYLDVDYENNGFLYDVAQQGPTLAFAWRF